MTLTLPLSCNKHVTIIITNALTMTSPDEGMICSTMIWKVLCLQKQAHPSLWLLNTRFGTDYQGTDGVTDQLAYTNATVMIFCSIEIVLSMVSRSPIQSSVYKIATRHHGCILVQNFTLASLWLCRSADVRVAKPLCGADNWTDYRLDVNILNFITHPARQPQGQKAIGCLQAETKQETNFPHWYLQKCGHVAAQFRGSRREHSTSKRISLISFWHPWT